MSEELYNIGKMFTKQNLPIPRLILSSCKTTSFRRMVCTNMKTPELPFNKTNKQANSCKIDYIHNT